MSACDGAAASKTKPCEVSSHIGLSAKRLKLLGVSPATVRLSVGIEDAGDLIADLEAALR